jgi:hypothetical protein
VGQQIVERFCHHCFYSFCLDQRVHAKSLSAMYPVAIHSIQSDKLIAE